MTARSWMLFAVVGALGLVVGLGAGALAWMDSGHSDSSPAAVGAAMPGTGTHGPSHSAMGAAGASLSERAFLGEMVPHHESAIAMAQIALTKTRHPAIRRLARDIVRSQKSEIARMRAWHREWYGAALGRGSAAAMMGADMGALEAASGDAFDRMFLAMMLPHHASALTMADSVKMSGPRREVVRLADEIIAAQATEIGRMQQWRERWYPPFG